MSQPFKRLIRFVGTDNFVHYGDAILPSGQTDSLYAREAFLIQGNPILDSSYTVTNTKLAIQQLLSPIDWASMPLTVRCLGLNYTKHANELSLPLPKFPVLFYKPRTSLNGPVSDLVVPKIAQLKDSFSIADKGSLVSEVDYEVELVVVIGKPARDVSVESALDYVLGYTAGNDYSHRVWQQGRGGGQWSLGKMYDGWAPIGPAIVHSSVISDPQSLKVQTRVNGEVVQSESTADMIFSVAQAVSFLSQGSTLLPGDVIFTGTPSGVAAGRKPQNWLKNGDFVEVEIENIGTVKNNIVYERKPKL